MALNLNNYSKQFYSIGEVAEMFDINETTLRYWEKEFSQISPKKTGGKMRRYTQDDIEQVRSPRTLEKEQGGNCTDRRGYRTLADCTHRVALPEKRTERTVITIAHGKGKDRIRVQQLRAGSRQMGRPMPRLRRMEHV